MNKNNKLQPGANQRFGADNYSQPYQGPQQSVNQDAGFNDLGREEARQMRESKQRFPRQVEKPTAGGNADLMRQIQQRFKVLQQQHLQSVGVQPSQMRKGLSSTPDVRPTTTNLNGTIHINSGRSQRVPNQTNTGDVYNEVGTRFVRKHRKGSPTFMDWWQQLPDAPKTKIV